MGKIKYTLLRALVFVPVLFVLALSTDSCNKPGIPIYIQIDSPTVTYNSYFGANTFAIPDVWATSGAANLGAYQMPVDIPILASGNVPIAISAGIYDNGIVSAPVQYPFYAPDTFTIHNAIPGHVYHHHPVYYYYAYTQVALNASFEGTNPFTNVTILPVGVGNNPALGIHCGGIILGPNVDSVVALESTPVPIVTNGRQAYLEFDFLANNPNVFCDVGINGTITTIGGTVTSTGQDDIKVVTAQGIWVKQYFDCSNWIGTFASGTGTGSDSTATFQVYFNVNHLTGTGVQDTFFIDNVKLLYFH